MFTIIKAITPFTKFEKLAPIAIKSANDFIVPYSELKKEIRVILSKPSQPKKEVYDFIDEEEVNYEIQPKSLKKHEKVPVPEATTPKNTKQKPVPEAAIPKTILKRPAPEAAVQKQEKGPTDEGPKPALQHILALFNPEMILMNEKQWGTHIHKYVTDEYVLIGQTKTMPMYRKRKQLMSEMEAIEKTDGYSIFNYPLVMQYIAWRHDIQLLVHLESPNKTIVAYPDMDLWRRDVRIYCLGNTSLSELKFKQVIEYIETAEDRGVIIEWPEADGKKTELLAELGGEGAHLKKDELARLVGKKRAYDLFGR
jgi:hypothetical protein